MRGEGQNEREVKVRVEEEGLQRGRRGPERSQVLGDRKARVSKRGVN
jgi:hypothetical protein